MALSVPTQKRYFVEYIQHENRPLIKEHKRFERELLRYCKGNRKVIFTKPFLMLGKVTFDEHVNALVRWWKGDISYTFTKP